MSQHSGDNHPLRTLTEADTAFIAGLHAAAPGNTLGCWRNLPRRAARRSSRLFRRSLPRLLLVSGDPSTPGHRYRVGDVADVVRTDTAEVRVMTVDDGAALLPAVNGADLVWIWRMEWRSPLVEIRHRTRHLSIPLLYDIDDLLFRPELARPEIVDGIRSQDLPATEIEAQFERIRRAVLAADAVTVPTEYLAREVRALGRPCHVIPNGYPRGTGGWFAPPHPDDGLVRIGYASGTLTHQRDLGSVAGAIAAVLARHPEARLVLFRGATDLDDLPDLQSVGGQIEWRDRVRQEDLPHELARFDVNIAPLQVGNPFCEAKSTLKFHEAALLGIPTVASPTEPFREAISDDRTGFLPETPGRWEAVLESLVASGERRQQVGAEARLACLWEFGPERRELLVDAVIRHALATGGPEAEALASPDESAAAPPAAPAATARRGNGWIVESNPGCTSAAVSTDTDTFVRAALQLAASRGRDRLQAVLVCGDEATAAAAHDRIRNKTPCAVVRSSVGWDRVPASAVCGASSAHLIMLPPGATPTSELVEWAEIAARLHPAAICCSARTSDGGRRSRRDAGVLPAARLVGPALLSRAVWADEACTAREARGESEIVADLRRRGARVITRRLPATVPASAAAPAALTASE